MVTRSAYKKGCESFDKSGASHQSIVLLWCSSGYYSSCVLKFFAKFTKVIYSWTKQTMWITLVYIYLNKYL